jgi:hypothetical protein
MIACKYLTHPIAVPVLKNVSLPLSRNLSSKRSSEMLPSLQTWHNVVAAVPISEILPPGFGNTYGIGVKESAWHGDKLIGQHVAFKLDAFLSSSMKNISHSTDKQIRKEIRHGVHMLRNVAVSNQLFADELKVILPEHIPKNISIISKQKVHDAGTMLEAAVFAVSNLSDPRKHESIALLAKHLIVKAAQGTKIFPTEINKKFLAFMKTGNLKSRLVEEFVAKSRLPKINEPISEDRALSILNKYGGKINCSDHRTATSKNHQGLFSATAKLNDTSVTSKATRKKLAKRQAAYSLLMKMKNAHSNYAM